MGYFELDEIWLLQGVGIGAAISDPQLKRQKDRLDEEDRAARETAWTVVTSEADHGSMRKRSEPVERGFQHVLDCGGARRTTLRGREKIRKRHLLQVTSTNLSLLMRHLAGVGTRRQARAGSHGARSALGQAILGIFSLLDARWTWPSTLKRPLALAAA